MKNIISGIAIALILFVGGGLLFIYSGTYNVAAVDDSGKWIDGFLHTTMTRSVERHAASVQRPAGLSLDDAELIRVGFDHYSEMCVTCHGAPGVNAGEIREGLHPQPPLLAEQGQDRSPEELFWIIKNGIRMTGMPAWGATHPDDTIWAMVAFVNQLPQMTPDGYQQMRDDVGASGHAAEHMHNDAHMHDHHD